MKYTDPIYDRTALDIKNKTSKAYFNFSDWNRIYSNSSLLRVLIQIILSVTTDFTEIAEANEYTIPYDYLVNALIENIENERIAIGEVPGVVALKHDWSKLKSPTYKDVNSLEKNIDLLLNYITAGYTGWDTSTGSGRFSRVGNATCGTGTTRQNGFRRYA